MDNKFKIFEIGFNKCATRAVYVLVRSSGIPSRHWLNGELALDLESAIQTDSVPFEKYDGIRFFSDIVYSDMQRVFEGYKHYKFLFDKFPDAKFIYNLRPKNAWLKSRAKHGNGYELNVYRNHLGLNTDEEVLSAWSRDWDEHLKNVTNFFNDMGASDRLLFIDINSPNFTEISEFIESPVDPATWEVVGKTQ